MNKGLMLAAFAVLLVGFAFADVNGASVVEGPTGKYQAPAAGSVVTEGGNVTEVNLTSNQSTEKWAGFYGNVSGALLLQQGTNGNALYVWTWAPTTAGAEVCVSTGNVFDWTAVAGSSTLATMDTLWGFLAADPDSITLTLDETASFTVGGVTSTTPGGTDLQTWQTFAINDGAEVAKTNYAFCVNMSTTKTHGATSGTGAFQVLAPTDDTLAATETFYFYVELN